MALIELPLIMTAFSASINHFAGNMLQSICNGKGIFSIGYINPESSIVGKNRVIMDINIATC